jgi:prevent-host-death family protein
VNIEPDKTWTVAEAKARLSEILRLASTEGPQRIGTKARYVIVPEKEWLKREEPQIPLGRYLVENLPRGYDDLELPDRAEPERPPLFSDWEPADSEDGK